MVIAFITPSIYILLQCNRQVAMSSFFSSILQPPVKLAVIGGGCSVATEPTAELSYFYNLTQVSEWTRMLY